MKRFVLLATHTETWQPTLRLNCVGSRLSSAPRGAPRLCTAPDGLSAYKNFDLRLDELLDEPSCAVGRLLAREWPLVQNERFSWRWLSRRCRAISRRQGAHRRSRRSPPHQNSSRSRSVRYGAADDGCRRESAGLRHQDTRCARPPHALPLGRCGSSRLSSSARDEPKGVSHARLGRSDGPNPSSARPRRWTLWSAWESFLECDWFRTSSAVGRCFACTRWAAGVASQPAVAAHAAAKGVPAPGTGPAFSRVFGVFASFSKTQRAKTRPHVRSLCARAASSFRVFEFSSFSKTSLV